MDVLVCVSSFEILELLLVDSDFEMEVLLLALVFALLDDGVLDSDAERDTRFDCDNEIDNEKELVGVAELKMDVVGLDDAVGSKKSNDKGLK